MQYFLTKLNTKTNKNSSLRTSVNAASNDSNEKIDGWKEDGKGDVYGVKAIIDKYPGNHKLSLPGRIYDSP